jgi:bacillaene synthase trans-acting acyltransferase
VPGRKTVFMFSGQGSHYFHMARPLFDQNEVFRKHMLRLDGMARQLSGVSVLEAMYAPTASKADVFDCTRLTHPAIFMVEYSLAHALMDAGVIPEMVLATSLGSFAAACVAGMLDTEAALTAVIQQARALEATCPPGGMIAILTDPALFAEDFLRTNSELAGINFATHFVVSAPQGKLAVIEAELARRNITYQRLPVSFAFHSRWIDPGKDDFIALTRSLAYRKPQVPLACCARVALLSAAPEAYFWEIARQPIRFRDMIAELESSNDRYRYIDVGPAGTLATFLRYGLEPTSQSTAHPIVTPFGHDQKNFAALVAVKDSR